MRTPMYSQGLLRFLLLVVSLSLTLCMLPGCGESGTAQDRVVILSPHWEGIQQEFERAFIEHWHETTGRTVEIEWLDQGGTSAIMRFIRDRFSQDSTGIGVDIFFGGGVDPHLRLTDMHLTQPVPMPDSILSRIPGSFAGVPMYDADGNWYGATMSGFGIIYNTAAAHHQGLEPPQTWEDMADPRLNTWILAGDPRMSGSVHMAYEIMLQAYGWQRGWEIITSLTANTSSFARSAGQIPLGVARGDAIAGMCIDFYAWSEVTHMGTDQLSFSYPVNLTAVNPDAICMLRGAPDEAVAREFIRFVMSEKGQRVWAFRLGTPGGPEKNQLNRFAVMPDIYENHTEELAVDINPFSWEITFRYDSQRGSSRWSLVNDMVGSMIIDSHRELAEAWRALIERGVSPEGVTALAAPPITEEQALALARALRDRSITIEDVRQDSVMRESVLLTDPDLLQDKQLLRNEYLNLWTQYARRRYEAVIRGDYGPVDMRGF